MTNEEKRLEYNRKQRLRRANSDNAITRKYEKTPNGFLMRAYRNMQSRVTGVQWRKAHLYLGKELLPREEFYEWAKNDKTFNRLFAEWADAGYSRRMSPSINRIDSNKGYLMGNIEWLTHSENSKLGNMHRCQLYGYRLPRR